MNGQIDFIDSPEYVVMLQNNMQTFFTGKSLQVMPDSFTGWAASQVNNEDHDILIVGTGSRKVKDVDVIASTE